MTLDYKSVTLEDLYIYTYHYFECDGDKKKIIIRRIESETE